MTLTIHDHKLLTTYFIITIIRVSNISCNMAGSMPLRMFFLTNATPEGEIVMSSINLSKV